MKLTIWFMTMLSAAVWVINSNWAPGFMLGVLIALCWLSYRFEKP